MRDIFQIATFFIDFSFLKKTAQSISFFSQNGRKEMVQMEDYKAVHMVFSFKAAFIDKAPGYSENALLLTVHTAYSAFRNKLLSKAPQNRWSLTPIFLNSRAPRKYWKPWKANFGGQGKEDLFNLKFH